MFFSCLKVLCNTVGKNNNPISATTASDNNDLVAEVFLAQNALALGACAAHTLAPPNARKQERPCVPLLAVGRLGPFTRACGREGHSWAGRSVGCRGGETRWYHRDAVLECDRLVMGAQPKWYVSRSSLEFRAMCSPQLLGKQAWVWSKVSEWQGSVP